MSQEKPAGNTQPQSGQQAPKKTPQSGGKVVQLKSPDACIAEECKTHSVRAGFCNEHYTWFKEGLLTKLGERPVDFEKKHFHFKQRQSKKTA